MNVEEYAEIVAEKFEGSEQYYVMKHNTELLISIHLINNYYVYYKPNIYFDGYAVEYWRNDTLNPDPSEVSEIDYGTLVKYFTIFKYNNHLTIYKTL